jgi:hypothetical protein
MRRHLSLARAAPPFKQPLTCDMQRSSIEAGGSPAPSMVATIQAMTTSP